MKFGPDYPEFAEIVSEQYFTDCFNKEKTFSYFGQHTHREKEDQTTTLTVIGNFDQVVITHEEDEDYKESKDNVQLGIVMRFHQEELFSIDLHIIKDPIENLRSLSYKDLDKHLNADNEFYTYTWTKDVPMKLFDIRHYLQGRFELHTYGSRKLTLTLSSIGVITYLDPMDKRSEDEKQ